MYPAAALQILASRRLGGIPQISGRGTVVLKVAGEHGLDQVAEDDLSAAGLGQGHPEHQDELKGVVEGEPVHSANRRLEDTMYCCQS